MKKISFSFKSLLVAAGLLIGSANAWGDGTKRVLYSEDFEDASTPAEVNWSGHSDANVAISTNASYSTYGKFISGWPNGNGNRSMGGTLSFTSSGYSTSAMTDLGYVIEFDALLKGGKQRNNSKTELILPYSASLRSNNNTYYDESTAGSYLFAISQSNTTGNFENTWYINDLSNSTGTTATLDYNIFYHWKFVVTKTSVAYTISAAGKDDITGSKDLTALDAVPLAKQVYMLLGRNSAWFLFDNIEIYDYTNAEVVSAPSFGAPAYAGDNRTVTITAGVSSKSNPVTTYYTTDGTTPSSSNKAGSFTTASETVTITSNCTVKAISISSEAKSNVTSSAAITVGKLTLNAPTFTKTAYSAGSYTISIDDEQSGLEFVPASTTIKYRVGTFGDFATYSSAVAVPAGKTLYAYAEAANYTTSSTSTVSVTALPAMTKAFGQNYVGVVDADLGMAVSAGPTVTNAKSTSDANYFIPSNDGGTSALTDENISFQFSKHATDDSQDKKWTFKTTGMYADYGRGYANVKIDNLTVGQIVVVNASAINSITGLTELTTYGYGTTHYYVATAATAYLNIERKKYIYSINVYTLDNETVGALDYSTGYFGDFNDTPVWINAGETGYYKFVNHNNGGATHQNWELFAATEASVNLTILRADNHINEGGGTITSFPTTSDIVADLCDATVELTVSLTDAGDGTNTLTSTAHITKADGTEMSPDYVYTQTGFDVSKLKLYVSAEGSWLELLEEAQKATISEAGYATLSSSNALDLTEANTPTGLTAYYVEKGNLTATSAPFTTINQTVAAGQGILLKGDAGTYNVSVAASGTELDDNALVATDGSEVAEGNYVFAYETANPSTTAGFYYLNANTTVAAGKAYLNPTTSGVKAFFIPFDGTATGINMVSGSEFQADEDGVIYNLNGQVVTKDYKGIVIKNGKKYFNK